jgi:hypothetical protein
MAADSRYSRPPTIRRYRVPPPQRSSIAAVTLRLVVLAAVATLIIGSLLAVQMASGSDPALGPKAVAQDKKVSTKRPTVRSSSAPSSTDLGTDPYAESYGGGGYGYSPPSSSGSPSGYTAGSAPAPVTSSTS